MNRQSIDLEDPITLQVMWDRLVFIADQADSALGRTAFSPIVRENHDYVTVLMDAQGKALAQCTWSIPVFITSLPMAVQQHFLPAFPTHTLQEGDVIATNDPMIGTGHLPDLVMVTPVFRKGRIVAYAGSIAHLPDIGGRPQSPDSTDMFEEGIRLPLHKMFKAGVPNEDVFAVLEASVRLPREVRGDVQSMYAANEVMSRELGRFMDEHDLDDLDGLGRAIHSRSEAHMRKAIAAWPNGRYSAELTLDGFETPIELKVAVEVRDDSIHVDYTGTSDQVARGINVMANYRIAHSMYALKCLLDPQTPNNEGCMLPITDSAPLGSVLNPRPCSAGSARHLIGHTIPSLIFRALQNVVPDRAIADSGGAPIWGINCQGQREDGSAYGSIQNFHGGQGGRSSLDGLDTLSFPSNCKVTPVEMYEIAVPILTECKQLITDSGGAGKFRGGLGQRGVLRNLSSVPMNVYLSTERVEHPCFGILGGGVGSSGRVEVDGVAVFPKGKLVLQPGQRLLVELPGGGGWGNPLERASELVERDLCEGLVSEQAARELYGYGG
ncbi:methylhydantoinase [Pseudomonas cerasi]|uniref:Methylhydantoinase n=1 Tax=Pseudomonas cerasi TaxID=1583341 RepID=A0A2K4VDQ6_9PSED|nr:hydantoinase B/oxoprolinase family protein [Pseudomonas cerasi]SOS21840.1 methylhydantoinase [Pseudomonas cerasi]